MLLTSAEMFQVNDFQHLFIEQESKRIFFVLSV